ncbi:MAG: hypothetical protein J6Y78_09105 [Paludibacteraceae bacterium]|nr:hypothetical protein [Paludibacteraceae bacterium]
MVACRPVVEEYDPNDWGEPYYPKVLGELVPKDGRAYNEAKERFETRMKRWGNDHRRVYKWQ